MPIGIPTKAFKPQAQMFINALKRPGAELGFERSLLSLISRMGRGSDEGTGLQFVRGGEYAERLKYEYDGATEAEFFDPNDPAPEGGQESYAEQDIPWGSVRSIVAVNLKDDFRSSGGAMSDTRYATLWAKRMNDAMASIISKVETALISGTGANDYDLKGLPYWIKDTGSIGSIALATNTWLKSKIKAAGGASLSKSFLREIRDLAYDQENVEPGQFVIVCSRLQMTKYQELFDDKLRTEVRRFGDLELETLTFDGIPFFPIPSYTNTKVTVLHMPDIYIKWGMIDDQKGAMGEASPRLAGVDVNGYPFGVHPLGASGHWERAEVFAYPQLIVKRSNVQLEIQGLAATYA